MKTLVIKDPVDCPYHDGSWDECGHQNGPEWCGMGVPAKCPLREGLTITVEEE